MGESLEFQNRGGKGKKLDVRLDLVDGEFVGLRHFIHCGDHEIITSYESGLCVAGPRVRGIGYSPLKITRKYKEFVPKGWHENVIDPNLPNTDDDSNRHLPLPDFQPTDLQDFTKKTAARWHIDLEFGEDLL